MAEKIPGGVISPHIKDGVIYWHCGDSFVLHLTLNVYSMGEKYSLSENDRVEVKFYDSGGFIVETFSVFAENNVISLNFDKSISEDFIRGRYTYDISVEISDGSISTIADDNVAVVL